MKGLATRIMLLAVVALAAPQALAQEIVSSLTATGALTCSTFSGHWSYVNGGRSGWHWYDYTYQQTQGTGSIPLDGVGGAKAVGTWYQPSYSALAYGSTSFANGASSALFEATLEEDTSFTPVLGAEENASVSSMATQSTQFSIASACTVSINVTGSAIAHMDDSSGTVIWSSTYGPFSGVLPAGSYFVEIISSFSASADTHTGTLLNWGKCRRKAGLVITWQPGGSE